ncbi:MAG: RAD55 family ATPase, partial [Promethearchaeota archaeon]
PKGHMIPVGGNTGTGKTTMGLHFLTRGIEEGEACTYVALEEHVEQVKRTAENHSWDLDAYKKSGSLKFVTASLIDLPPDKLIYAIVDDVNERGVERVFFDSLSSIYSASLTTEQVRQFLIQLSGFFKTKGVTAIFSYLTSKIFGAGQGQLLGESSTSEMRLSSVMDGVILLRYLEDDCTVAKLLNVLKMRGSGHSRDIFRFELSEKGLELGDKF